MLPDHPKNRRTGTANLRTRFSRRDSSRQRDGSLDSHYRLSKSLRSHYCTQRYGGGTRIRGEGYGKHKLTAADAALSDDVQLPAFTLAIAPVVSVIALNAA